MTLFGLTGGIGMGKSTSAAFLTKRGVAVVDTDEIARELVRPGEPALAEISSAFGPELIDARGQLRRGALAELVFASAEKRQRLEAILHPRIRARWLAQVENWRRENKPMAVVIIPLLFETNAAAHFDVVVCTACSAATQRERLRARGWPGEQIEQRIAAQWPVESKLSASHFVIWTEGMLHVHEQQIDCVLASHSGKCR